jgi:UDP-N-acetylglucosamine--N-acetylmuramyl-(pentapeptide) pyrophosphoryl-undecaprenol N-acetylglucosamine transferase
VSRTNNNPILSTTNYKLTMKILFTGGGTQGHIMPIIAISQELRKLYQDDNIALHYMGPKDDLGFLRLSQEDFTIHRIASGKIRRYFSLENITDVLFKIPFGFLESFFILLLVRPNLVFSKGGSGSAVVCLCANLLGISVFLHESDSVPGLSNKIVARFAKKIFISFPKTDYFDESKTILVGNPIKEDLLQGNKNTAQELFHVTFEKPILLFLGGSQGAQSINDFVLNILTTLLQKYEIIHMCGKKNYTQVLAESKAIITKDVEPYYHLYGILDEIELKHALAAADFIISRAGSGSIFEIAGVGKPSILVPLPLSAHGHQSKNAYEYASTGAAIVIEQENLQPNFFMEKIQFVLHNQEELQNMRQSALNFAKPLAAKAIAREILEYLHV